MPQPLSRVAPNAGYMLCNIGSYPLEDRPELGQLAMRLVAAWSTLEAFMGAVFVAMLGGSAAPTVAVYNSLTSTSAQKAAFRAVSDQILNEAELELVNVLLELYTQAAKRRNKIAHWIWGLVSSIPDGVILCDPAEFIQSQMRVAEVKLKVEKGEIPLQDVIHAEIQAQPSKSKMYVYKKADFLEAIDLVEQVSRHLLKFAILLQRRGSRLYDTQYDELCREPAIQTSLSRRRTGLKTPPSE